MGEVYRARDAKLGRELAINEPRHRRDARTVCHRSIEYAEDTMTREVERAYVKQWAETGRLLEETRWRELAALDPETALRASDALIEAALRVPLPPHRRAWSGLIEQQAVLHRRTSA